MWRVSAHPILFQLLGHPTYTHDPPVRKPVAKVKTKAGSELAVRDPNLRDPNPSDKYHITNKAVKD